MFAAFVGSSTIICRCPYRYPTALARSTTGTSSRIPSSYLISLPAQALVATQPRQSVGLSMSTGTSGGRSGRRGGRGGRSRNNSSRGNRRRSGRRSRPQPPPMPPPGQPGRNCYRSCISVGREVYVVKKEDQRSQRETRGIVSRLLTNSAYHPRGIKVMLSRDDIVGRVTRILDEVDAEKVAEAEEAPSDKMEKDD